MATLITRSLRPGERSLPAEIRSPYRGTRAFGQNRLHLAQGMVQGHGGMQGLGDDTCDVEIDPTCSGGGTAVSIPVDTSISYDPTTNTSSAGGYIQWQGAPVDLSPSSPAPTGISSTQWAQIATQLSNGILKTVVATSPGTLLITKADGSQVLYSQPAGSTTNLPIGANTVTTPLGTASGSSIMWIGLALFGAVLLARR